jgi:hypothetical protein
VDPARAGQAEEVQLAAARLAGLDGVDEDGVLEEAISRGKKRDREEYQNPNDECWDGTWKKNDLEYYAVFEPDKKADIVISNT